MKTKMASSALLLSLAFGWATAAQSTEPGWYVIGFGGEATASGSSQDQMDDNLVAVFGSVGLEVLDISSTLDDSDTGFGITGGYQLNDHFAFEFAYVDLGSVTYRASATVTDGVEQADTDVELESSAAGPVISALGILPIGERFSLFGRVGISLLNAEGTARVTLQGDTQRDSQTSQKSDPMAGIGAELSLSRHFAVRLAWDRYFDIGTADVTGDVDADVFILGVRMGLGWFR